MQSKYGILYHQKLVQADKKEMKYLVLLHRQLVAQFDKKEILLFIIPI